MKLQLDIVQQALRAQLRAIPEDQKATPELLAPLGLWGFSLPVEGGGLELGVGAAVIAWEELGRRLTATSLTDTVLVADVAAAAGLGRLGVNWFERVAAGRVTSMLIGHRGAQLSLREDRLYGRSEAVPAPQAPVDDLFAVAETPSGATLFRVAGDDSAVCFREVEGGRGVGEYVLDGAKAGARACDWGEAHRLIGTALPATWLRHAGYLLGTAERMLALTARHVRQRQQFGKALLEFQSVSLRLAEIRARIEAVRMLVHYGAWCLDTGEDMREPSAAEALAGAAELALHVSRTMMQLHGAYGMLLSSPTAQAYRTVAFEAVRFGTPSALWTAAGRTRLGMSHQG